MSPAPRYPWRPPVSWRQTLARYTLTNCSLPDLYCSPRQIMCSPTYTGPSGGLYKIRDAHIIQRHLDESTVTDFVSDFDCAGIPIASSMGPGSCLGICARGRLAEEESLLKQVSPRHHSLSTRPANAMPLQLFQIMLVPYEVC